MIRAVSTATAFLIANLLGLASVGASAEPKVTYVGLDRYSCSGTAPECAQINYNNGQVEEANRGRYQKEQQRAQRSVEATRRQEREYERERRRE